MGVWVVVVVCYCYEIFVVAMRYVVDIVVVDVLLQMVFYFS